MRFRSKLLQPRKASEPTLMKIRDLYITPDGRVEDDLGETVKRDADVPAVLIEAIWGGRKRTVHAP